VTAKPSPATWTLRESNPGHVVRALASDGLWIDLGASTVRVRSNSLVFASQLQLVYGALPFVDQADWADVHIEIRRATGLRRWLRPQVVLWCDGQQPFEPFPADSPLPLFEWGCNWQIAHRLNHLLLLHAGTVERDGFALVLPAMPGSGKSTLTAALSQRGWRLLSDEFGVFDPEAGAFRAMLKPIGLKNQSIEVIRAFAPQARFGPEFSKTRKGRVAHVAATDDAVARRHETARPGAIVLPKWEAGSPTRWEPLAEHVAFPALAFNAFNYTVLGAAGFRAVVALMRQCPAWQLVYSDLDDALATIDAAWPAIVEAHSGSAP
jgi:HprK-related kinase A